MTVLIEAYFRGTAYDLERPRVCWRRASGTVTATTEAAGFAADNAGTVRTDSAWRPTALPATWTLTFAAAETVSYVAIGAHDLSTQNATVTVEYLVGATWTSWGFSHQPENNDPIVFLVEPRSVDGIRVNVTTADSEPTIAVIASGLATEWPRKADWVGTPITEGDNIRFTNNLSQTGNWLGRTRISDGLQFDVRIDNLPEDWRQTEFAEFKIYANGENASFFIATWPNKYPDEVAYAFLTDTLRMERAQPNRRVSGSVTLSCRAYRQNF